MIKMLDCLKIGEINKLGVKKTYSCIQFSKIDKNFILSLWCSNCQRRMGIVNPKSKLEYDSYR